MAWIKPTNQTSWNSIIGNKYNQPDGCFILYLDSSNLVFATALEPDTRIRTSYEVGLIDGEWHVYGSD